MPATQAASLIDPAAPADVLTTAVDARAVAAELDRTGFVCVENAISPAWLERAREDIARMVAEKGNRYFAINWPSRERGSPAEEMVTDPAVKALLEELVRLGCPKATTEEEVYNVLRVVAGKSGGKKSLIYHYDNTVITALVPILIPPGEDRQAGELLVFPNRRGYRSSALVNIAEKVVVQSDFYRERVSRGLPAGELDQIKILKPGNLYFFWGYRTYHANFPVSSDVVRATLLLHHGDPHAGSLPLRAIKALNLFRERRALKHGLRGAA